MKCLSWLRRKAGKRRNVVARSRLKDCLPRKRFVLICAGHSQLTLTCFTTHGTTQKEKTQRTGKMFSSCLVDQQDCPRIFFQERKTSRCLLPSNQIWQSQPFFPPKKVAEAKPGLFRFHPPTEGLDRLTKVPFSWVGPFHICYLCKPFVSLLGSPQYSKETRDWLISKVYCTNHRWQMISKFPLDGMVEWMFQPEHILTAECRSLTFFIKLNT